MRAGSRRYDSEIGRVKLPEFTNEVQLLVRMVAWELWMHPRATRGFLSARGCRWTWDMNTVHAMTEERVTDFRPGAQGPSASSGRLANRAAMPVIISSSSPASIENASDFV